MNKELKFEKMTEENNNLKTPEYYKKLSIISLIFGAISVLLPLSLVAIMVSERIQLYVFPKWILFLVFLGIPGVLGISGFILGIIGLKADHKTNGIVGVSFCIIGFLASLLSVVLINA